MKFYEFPWIPNFFPSGDFHSVYEFPWIPNFFPSGDFHSVFYNLYGYSTNSNLSSHPRKGKKLF
ncbi:hypothetical protein BH23THE1_BH23THE1_00020 [soil metagenome]